ncbi:hypothetical protein ACJMK2_027170 [Sinanodonta woodiana]|uniref:Protein zer-1 homolog-like C-terminal domain-containing protein n=1 Tax=Sinanodonta woodiana TaxID=1069815 RepID=A0ABD3XP34_SINWO
MTEPREDILKLLLLDIKQNPNHNVIQARALFYILNLLRTELGPNVHPSCLKDIVCHTLRAMANFPRNQQIQNYAVYTLFTLFMKRILQNICDIDKTATLIMECICSFDAPAMLFRCLDMLDFLSAMISTDLGSDSRYMKKLLQLLDHSAVNERMEIAVDAILIVLGNFTAHSPLACQVLVAEGGLDTGNGIVCLGIVCLGTVSLGIVCLNTIGLNVIFQDRSSVTFCDRCCRGPSMYLPMKGERALFLDVSSIVKGNKLICLLLLLKGGLVTFSIANGDIIQYCSKGKTASTTFASRFATTAQLYED